MEVVLFAGACVNPTSLSSVDRTLCVRYEASTKSSEYHVTVRNSPFLGGTFSPKGLLSYSKKCRRVPSALLNSHEYKKKKLEKLFLKEMGSDGESDTTDEDLCPIECVREITTLRELEHIIQESKSAGDLVVVDFFRTSCGSCRYIEKGFQKLCKGAGNGEASVIFVKHNVVNEYDEQSDIAERLRIKIVPLFHFYKNGKLVASFATRDKARILQTIYKHLDVIQTIEEWSDIHGLDANRFEGSTCRWPH